jgi:hypothetical protein
MDAPDRADEWRSIGRASMTPLDTFHERAARRAGAMPLDQAVPWLVGQGLFARAIRERLPEEHAARLVAAARRNLARNLHWIDAFARLVDALGEGPEPIPVCPLKGITLLGSVYAQEPEARALTDLDVLVPESRIEEAIARLGERLGLRERPASAAARRHHHERTLEGERLVVDVHSRLGVGWGEATRYEALATTDAELHGRPVRLLADADTLVHLLGHLVRHGPFVRLAWAEDALRVARSGEGVTVESLAEAASRLGARGVVLAGVSALRWLSNEAFLTGLEDRLRPSDRRRVSCCVALLWRRQRRDSMGEPASGSVRRLLSGVLLADSIAASAAVVSAKVGGVRIGQTQSP